MGMFVFGFKTASRSMLPQHFWNPVSIYFEVLAKKMCYLGLQAGFIPKESKVLVS